MPGDPAEPEGRYATLARCLTAKGHKVCWWTSSFSHRFKKPIDQQTIIATCKPIGIEIQFMTVPPYHRNIGFKRLWNHHLLARYFQKHARNKSERPDVIVASSPPPMLSLRAAKYAKESGAKILIDTQDLWPKAFYPLIPRMLRVFSPLLFAPWHTAVKKAYKLADALVGSAEAYIVRARKLGGDKRITSVIPLGLDCQLFDSAVSEGYCKEFTKPKGEIWFIYAGSLTRNHDFLTSIHAYAKAHETLHAPTKLLIAGRGYLSDKVRDIIEEQKLTNVIQTGFLDLNKLAYLLSQCDVGINPSWPETMIYLPYKLFYYFAAGLAVLNTMPGECSRIITQEQCGLNYAAGDIDSCARAIRDIIKNPNNLFRMKENSRRLAKTVYDRKVLYQKYVDLIEKVAAIS